MSSALSALKTTVVVTALLVCAPSFSVAKFGTPQGVVIALNYHEENESAGESQSAAILSLAARSIPLGVECKCQPAGNHALHRPLPTAYPATCLPGWCYSARRSKVLMWSLDGHFVAKLEIPRQTKWKEEVFACDVADSYFHWYSEYHSARFLRSLRGSSQLLLRENDLPWHSEVFEVSVDTPPGLCPVTAPAFLTNRTYGKVVHSPSDLSDLQYLTVGDRDWARHAMTEEEGMSAVEVHGYADGNITVLTDSVLRLEAFVAEQGLLFHDTQFIVSRTGVELFDTMVAQGQGLGGGNCTTRSVEDDDPCLATTYLRAYLLQTALGLTLQQTYFDTDAGSTWRQQLLEAQQSTSQRCQHKRKAVLIGVPTAIPAVVLAEIEQDATGGRLLLRLRLLERQFARSASNTAGIMCLEELPVPLQSKAIRCGENPNESAVIWKELFHLPDSFKAQMAEVVEQFGGSCTGWTFPSYQL